MQIVTSLIGGDTSRGEDRAGSCWGNQSQSIARQSVKRGDQYLESRRDNDDLEQAPGKSDAQSDRDAGPEVRRPA